MSGAINTAYVLGGGGRWGAVEVGMLRALDEAGIQPDIILGTSIGAFNGSMIADDPGSAGVQRLADFWDELTGTGLFQNSLLSRIKNVATLQPAIHRSAGLQLALEHIHGMGKRIEDLQVPFQCVAASIERAAEHWFTRGPLIPALLASSAVPVLFPPVEIEGEHFYDGGLVNSVPLTRAVDQGASVIYVLQVGRLEAPLRPPQRLYEAALISFEIARRNRYATAMENLPPDVVVHVLPSGNPVEFDDRRQLRWRDTGDTSDLIDGAYTVSGTYLKENGLS
ncbi:MAG: patatin-like phospholipase family protein [Actinobacteria bacterium]|nr:patatin-like phospholipase family protein [Actinomycetota bacterium]